MPTSGESGALRGQDDGSRSGYSKSAEPIPLVDLGAQYKSIKAEIDLVVSRVLEQGQFVLGPEVESFESEFAAFCGAKFAVGLNSGTSALHLALLAARVGAGDEVITVPMTFVATAAAILYTGARPIFVDIDPTTYTMDPRQLEAAITPRTKAIVPVHLYGQMAAMDEITAVARRHGLVVIEDAAQAHGAIFHGRGAGTIGDIGCFSFYPGKNLGACGEAGAVVTDDPKIARTIRMLRHWGQERRHDHELHGYNYRLDALQAAILRVKLRRLREWTEARRAHARLYDQLLAKSNVKTPASTPDGQHVYHIYGIRTARRDEVLARLEERGIQAAIHYPRPVYLQSAYGDLGYQRGAFPNSEALAQEELSLPMYPELTVEQIHAVADAVQAAIA
jgi:dTDP-4-amino-4,6-dideoxygalactose transaminase